MEISVGGWRVQERGAELLPPLAAAGAPSPRGVLHGLPSQQDVGTTAPNEIVHGHQGPTNPLLLVCPTWFRPVGTCPHSTEGRG